MLNRKAKEELIIKLLEEGKTYKEISKEAHASFSEISRINKTLNGEDSRPSIQNQAYKMFQEEKKRPIDVAIALQIDNMEATKYWKEYLQLKREYKFLEIRYKLKGNFFPFVELFELMQKKKYGIKELEAAVQIAFDAEVEGTFLEYLKDGVSKTQAQLDVLHKQKKELENELSSLKAEKEYMERTKQVLLFEIAILVKHKPYIERLFSSPQISPRPINRSFQLDMQMSRVR